MTFFPENRGRNALRVATLLERCRNDRTPPHVRTIGEEYRRMTDAEEDAVFEAAMQSPRVLDALAKDVFAFPPTATDMAAAHEEAERAAFDQKNEGDRFE